MNSQQKITKETKILTLRSLRLLAKAFGVAFCKKGRRYVRGRTDGQLNTVPRTLAYYRKDITLSNALAFLSALFN